MIPLRKTKIILISLIIINIVLFYAYFSFYNILKTTRKDNSDMMAKIETEKYKESTRENMENELLASGPDAESLRDYIINREGEVDFIKEIETIANDLGLASEIKSVKVEPIKDATTTEELRMSIDVIGKWSSVYNFARKLEMVPFKVKIYKVNLEKFSEEALKGKVSVMWLGQFDFSVIKLK